MISLIYPSSPWRTLEMPLINCEVNLIFSWSANCPLVTDIVTNNVANIYNIRYKNLCFSHNFINSGNAKPPEKLECVYQSDYQSEITT